jgi:hypothetical protein
VAIAGTATADRWFDDPVETPLDQRLLRIEVADINRDGLDDVVGNAVSYEYLVFQANHNGTMTQVQALPAVLWGQSVLFDENRDGWPDLLCEIPDDRIQLWTNDGTGTFLDSGRLIAASALLDKGDQDGDGLTDILVEFAWDSLGIYYGTSDGLSEEPHTISMAYPDEPPLTFWNDTVAIVDLNCDGVGDIFAAGGLWNEYVAEMRWRLGLGDRTFGEVRSCGGAVLSDYGSFDVADLDADGDLEIAIMWVGFEWGDTRIYTYNTAINDLEYMGLAPNVGPPRFARMDGDELWDLYMRQSGTTTIFRGLGGINFQGIQSVAGYDAERGSVILPPGKDLICVSMDPPHWIHVHPNLTTPASIDSRDLQRSDQPRLNVSPSVASSWAQISLAGSGLAVPSVVRISDVVGREVRTLTLRNAAASWDLRDNRGEPVRSGLYWLSAQIRGGRRISSRVLVVQ